jgi:hypothetical protein
VKYLIWLCMYLGGASALAQGLHIEVGGKTLLIASLAYERLLGENEHLCAGFSLGFTHLERGDIIRQTPGGANERGRFTNLVLGSSLYGLGTWGHTHRLYLPLGLTAQFQANFNRYPSGHENGLKVLFAPFAGVGYAWHPGPWFFRVVGYGLYIGEKASGFFPPLIPWAGLSVGRTLGAHTSPAQP